MRTRPVRWTVSVAALCLGLLSCGVEDPDPGPDPRDDDPVEQPEEARSATLDERVTLARGESVAVDALRITLLEAEAPDDDCFDCPLRAMVEVTDGTETERLAYRFTGNMAPEASEAARTQDAFGYRIRMRRVVDDEIDLTVSRG